MEGSEEVKRPSQQGVGARIRLDSVKGFDSASRYIEEVKRYFRLTLPAEGIFHDMD